MTSIAMIMTGSSVWTMKDGTPHPTGFWAEEFVKPHRTFAGAGLEVTLSTPQGRTPTVDPLSYNLAYNANDEGVVARFWPRSATGLPASCRPTAPTAPGCSRADDSRASPTLRRPRRAWPATPPGCSRTGSG
jgi:putative intracellular protease/amidase